MKQSMLSNVFFRVFLTILEIVIFSLALPAIFFVGAVGAEIGNWLFRFYPPFGWYGSALLVGLGIKMWFDERHRKKYEEGDKYNYRVPFHNQIVGWFKKSLQG